MTLTGGSVGFQIGGEASATAGDPHSWPHIDVKGADGSVERWKIEGGLPSVLMRITDESVPGV